MICSMFFIFKTLKKFNFSPFSHSSPQHTVSQPLFFPLPFSTFPCPATLHISSVFFLVLFSFSLRSFKVFYLCIYKALITRAYRGHISQKNLLVFSNGNYNTSLHEISVWGAGRITQWTIIHHWTWTLLLQEKI